MKRILLLIVLIMTAGPWAMAADWKETAREPVDRRLTLDKPGEAVVLDVDNVIGAITVQAADVGDVHLTATRTTRAASAADLQRAAREVRLDVTQKENRVRVYVDGPFRDRHGSRNEKYVVRYDFTLTVPRRTEVRLRTVTDGDIRVDGVSGDFDVANVNGAVALAALAGSGSARTVNGTLRASFRANPAAACAFATVNGDIDLTFADGLDADLKLQTVNGEAWSDFDFTRLPSAPAAAGERRDGRLRVACDRAKHVRIGRGGTALSLETVNGDMTIARNAHPSVKKGV